MVLKLQKPIRAAGIKEKIKNLDDNSRAFVKSDGHRFPVTGVYIEKTMFDKNILRIV